MSAWPTAHWANSNMTVAWATFALVVPWFPPFGGNPGEKIALVIDNPVNLRGSLDALPEEGSCAPERSASSVEQFGAPCARAIGAQPQRASLIGSQSACTARGEPRCLIYRSRTAGRAGGGRFDRAMGDAFQPGRIGSGGTAAWWSTTNRVRSTAARTDSGGVSASARSRARWYGDVVVEYLTACSAARSGWSAKGQHVHDLGGAARRRHHLAERPDLVPNRRGHSPAQTWRGQGPGPGRQREKRLIEQAYTEGERMGLAVWGMDEAGPYQAIPQPGD